MSPAVPPLTEADWAAMADGVRRLARALVYDADRAEDVAQEALAIAAARPGPAPEGLRAWLAGVVRNVARNVVRGDRHRRERERVAARPEALPPTADLVERLAEQRRVIDAVMRLEEPTRSAVVLRYFEGLGVADVAQRLDVPLETVRTRLRRGRDRLRRELDAAHGGERRRWVQALVVPLSLPGWAGETAVATLAGGLLMKKAIALVVLLALLGWGGYRLFFGEDRALGPLPAHPPSGFQVPTSSQAPPPGPVLLGSGPAPDAASGVVAAPIDFSALDRDRDLHGTVVDGGGRAVPGASVEALVVESAPRPTGGRPWGVQEVPLGRDRTRADGSFALRLARGASVNLRVAAAGFGTVERTFSLAGGRVRVVLEPAVRLTVRVRDEQDQAVEGADVRFFQSGHFMSGMARAPFAFRHEGRSDRDGRCVFAALPQGVWGEIDVTHPRLGSPGWQHVTLDRAPEQTRDVVLPVGLLLRGRVVVAATGEPLAGAWVGAGWYQQRAVRTDTEGRYEFPGWTGAGHATLSASSPGFVLTEAPVGERTEINFALPRARTLTGRVVDRSGAPVPDATVRACSKSDPNGALPGTATSGADGRFELRTLRTDEAYEVQASRAGTGAGRVLLEAGESPIEADDLVLVPGRRVEGRVVDADGAAVEGLEVLLGGTRARGWAVTDDLGRFRFADIEVGTHELTVRGGGRGGVTRPIEVPAADLLGVEVVVAGGRPFHVVVEAPGAEAPLEGVEVWVRGAGGAPHRAYTDASGRADLLVGEGELRVRTGSWLPDGWLAPAEQRVPGQASEARLVLRKADWLEGDVRRPDGTPVAYAHVLCTSEDGDVRGAVADARGRFRCAGLPEAVYAVEFVGLAGTEGAAGTPGPPLPLHALVRGVRAGEALVLRARDMALDRTLDLDVCGPDGRPLPGATVLCMDLMRSWRTDATGAAHLDGLPERPLRLQVMPEPQQVNELGWLSIRLDDLVPRGQRLTLAIRVGARLLGRVTGPAALVGRRMVRAVKSGRTLALTQSDAEGAFVLVVDAATDFPLTVQASSTPQAEFDVVRALDALPSGEIELPLPSR